VKTNLEKGEKAAREALRLNERSATGYAGLAFFEHARSKWIEAEDHYKKALEPGPGTTPTSMNNMNNHLALYACKMW
jgi:hypothetical protein